MVFFLFTQIALAESLFFNNFYDLAVVEYKRLFFYDTIFDKDIQIRLHYTISLLNIDYFKGYEETIRLIKEFPDLDNDSKFILARALIKTGNYSLAIEILKETSESKLLGYSYLCNGQYYSALKEFQSVDDNLAKEVRNLINRPEKSITRAMLYSAILPGSGEIYAGDIKQGLQDFSATLLSSVLLYISIKDKKYVDAGLIFSFLFNRFYLGSISKAGMIAHRYNKNLEDKWLDYITNKYFNE